MGAYVCISTDKMSISLNPDGVFLTLKGGPVDTSIELSREQFRILGEAYTLVKTAGLLWSK